MTVNECIKNFFQSLTTGTVRQWKYHGHIVASAFRIELVQDVHALLCWRQLVRIAYFGLWYGFELTMSSTGPYVFRQRIDAWLRKQFGQRNFYFKFFLDAGHQPCGF